MSLIFFLQEAQELKHPYETTINGLGLQVEWFETFESLKNKKTPASPLAIVIDLDIFQNKLDESLEEIKQIFPKSDLVALSSQDSSQLAIRCIRLGFGDFLLKPSSPEELSFALRKTIQNQSILKQIHGSHQSLARLATQISSNTSNTLVYMQTLEFLCTVFSAQGAAWIRKDEKTHQFSRVLFSYPKQESPKHIFESFFKENEEPTNKNFKLLLKKKSNERRIILKCEEMNQEYAVFWGIKSPIKKLQVTQAQTLLAHSCLCLLNLKRFEEVKKQTFLDDLTGLYNSRYLKFAVLNSIQRAKKSEEDFSILFIDVDHFKRINDKYTHIVGSELLATIGKTIKHSVRRIDAVFRYGGDEFVVVLNGTDTDGAFEIAERIRKNIERRIFVIDKNKIQATVSIGIATYPTHTSDKDTLLKMADEAMYSAKRSTRNVVHLASLPEEQKFPLAS